MRSMAPGTVVHIVLFAYTPDTTPAQKADIAGAFLGLKDACVRPGTRTPYILSVDGGPNHSPEDVGQAHEVRPPLSLSPPPSLTSGAARIRAYVRHARGPRLLCG
jgi:hypothetical protein